MGRTLTPVRWGCRNGNLAHALGRRYPGDQRDRALCGAYRYGGSHYRKETSRDVRCLRCLRITGIETPKALREQIEIANLTVRTLRAQARRKP